MKYPFPFHLVPPNCNIVIYGAGKVGESFVEQVRKKKYCNIVAILDKNKFHSKIDKYDILLPEKIAEISYDMILLAVNSLSIANEMIVNLYGLGVPYRKILNGANWLIENNVELLSTYVLEPRNSRGLFNIIDTIELRLMRLEILQYYSIPGNLNRLNEEQLQTLKEVENYNDLMNRVYPEDEFYRTKSNEWYYTSWHVIPSDYCEDSLGFEPGKGYYANFSNQRLYLTANRNVAAHFLKYLYIFYDWQNSPHKYLAPDDDGLDILPGAVFADVGACEGYIGLKYSERCSKIYYFEPDENWISELRKTIGNNEKFELIGKACGDKGEMLRLDDFFASFLKGAPIQLVVKIDVEGAELAVLRGMKKLIESEVPLLLLIATYHHQEDWERFEQFLNPPDVKPQFLISHSRGYFWQIPDAKPPYFRRGIMRAKKILK